MDRNDHHTKRKLIPMNRIILIGSLLLNSTVLSACTHTSVQKDQLLSLTGIVAVADSDTSNTALRVDVNNYQLRVNADGTFAVQIDDQDVYTITISGNEVYTSTHTFSRAELAVEDHGLTVPPITVVSRKPRRRLLTFGGDTMIGRRYLEPRWNEEKLVHDKSRVQDMKNILAGMKPYFEPADFSAVNLETILSETEIANHAPKSVVFYTHPDILRALEWMGADYVSLGNNHTYDYLDEGLEATLDALSQSKIGYSGAGMNEVEALKPFTTDLAGVPLSAWGYVGWAGRVTPNQVAEANKGGAAHGTEENIVNSVKARAKVDQIDVVQYHGSREYSEGPTETTERRLKSAIDAGADLVIAHHPHVAQGFEIYKDKLIAYSLGNFAFDQFFYATHASVAVNVWMDGDVFYRAEIIPLHVKGYKPFPATNSVRTYVLDRITRLSATNGTNVGWSGGHGIIKADNSGFPEKSTSQDSFFVGDFESYSLFDTNERTWFAENAGFKPVYTARSGRYALELKPEGDTTVTFGLKTFARVYSTDKMRWTGYVKAKKGTNISAFIQYRPKGMNRYKALEEAPFFPIGKVAQSADTWLSFAFDFIPQLSGQNEARIILKIDGSDTPILFDDIQLVPTP